MVDGLAGEHSGAAAVETQLWAGKVPQNSDNWESGSSGNELGDPRGGQAFGSGSCSNGSCARWKGPAWVLHR